MLKSDNELLFELISNSRYLSNSQYLMIYFYTIEHIEIMGYKDLVHIVKVSDDTFV